MFGRGSIKGQGSDSAEAQAGYEMLWLDETVPGAIGWVGNHSAGASDTTARLRRKLARTESQDAARRNSGRPEQDECGARRRVFTGQPIFQDCSEVVQMGPHI